MSKELSAEEAQDLLETGDVTVVDVRELMKYREGHIPGSVCIPIADFPKCISELEGREPILAVCEVGDASRHAARYLDAFEGVDGNRVYNLKDGLEKWNGKMVKSDEKVMRGCVEMAD